MVIGEDREHIHNMNGGCRLHSRIQSVTQIFSKTYAYPYINMHGEKTGGVRGNLTYLL